MAYVIKKEENEYTVEQHNEPNDKKVIHTGCSEALALKSVLKDSGITVYYS